MSHICAVWVLMPQTRFCINSQMLSANVIDVKQGIKWKSFLPPANEVFTPVCHSVHRGDVPPWTRYTPLGPGTTPLDQLHPPLDQLHPPLDQLHPLDQVHPHGTRYTPQDQVHPQQVHPPGRYTHTVVSFNLALCNGFKIRDYFQEKHVGEDNILFTNHLVGK